jgi:MYXO-CTERM domain-containing protein
VTAVASTAFDPSPYLGKTLYVFIGNGATLESSSQFAVLQSVETVGADNPVDNNNIKFVTSTPIFGGYSTGTYDGTPFGLDSSVSAQAVNLVTVPEPSAALLGGLGALALLRRRRVA